MGSKRTKKAPHPVITLGVPEPDELAPSNTPYSAPNQSTPLTDDETDPFEEGTQKRAPQIRWTLEIEEALVEYIHKVWLDGRASDNRFKKEVFVEAAVAVNRVTRDGTEVL
jgi:hypothetical protein